jgi:hypothetical protein
LRNRWVRLAGGTLRTVVEGALVNEAADISLRRSTGFGWGESKSALIERARTGFSQAD